MNNVLAYTDSTFTPSDKAILWFFERSDKGIIPIRSLSQDYYDYGILLSGHHMMSGAQEAMWLEAHFSGDYPLGALIRNYIADIGDDVSRYNRKVPAFRKDVRLWIDFCYVHYAKVKQDGR